ncbi:helix-turn-helix domain-containing protein [Virgibacillus halodenitrificans]|uniref:helix-turn-helix domain-containing protein n=1 Tax=Virgibacillus halodenitrificans TaxID=1482 RepID=UPI001FB2F242|nr:helix-turn-helix transcriptional regulator [Virgibacillus halodenitrificans]MCJ0932964.1 helix-turn-helix domain-containing protein [Virgibacillus halodenitrificans]
MTIGERISKERKRRNLTQEGLAKRIGISRAALSHYEKDRREPDYETLDKMANFFEVSSDYLLGRIDNPNYNVMDGLKKANKSLKDYDFKFTSEEEKRTAIINRIAGEFPNIDLMFDDLSSFSAEELQDVYEYIKFKKSQKGDK